MLPGELPLRAFLEPIRSELTDRRTTEIVVNRPGEVGIEQGGEWHWRDVPEFTFERLDQIGILAAYQTGRNFDADNPFAGSTLPDGQRIHLARPGATAPGIISMCIRKPSATARKVDDEDFSALFTKVNAPVSRSRQNDDELVHLLKTKQMRAFFKLARRSKKTVDVCGPTGGGKTDFLKRLMQETDKGARILTIESDAEFGPVGPRNYVNFFFNEQHPRMQPEMAVAAALRFRPDEIWFQETRGAEAWAVMRARAAGHRGGGTSWHASEGMEIAALMLMMRQHDAAKSLEDDVLRALCLQYVDIIVWCDRVPDEGFQIPRVWMKGREA